MSLTVAMLLHKSVEHDSRVRREAAALAEAGHRVTVVELDPAATGTLDGFRRVSAAPPGWVRRALPRPLYRALFLAGFLARIVALRPDVVHAHDAAMLLPGLAGARLTGARLVYDSHELATGVPYRERHWMRFVEGVERLAVPRAAAVITVSDGIAERLQERYGLRRRPCVVRNVCALPVDGERPRRAARGPGPATVLHQGAAAPGRGCETLLRAMAGVPEAKLVFLGDGEPAYVATLRDLARSLGLGERVEFAPAVPLAELLDRTAQADVGVSLLEDTCENHRLALPNKLFEYAAAGVPVVASDLPELRRAVGVLGIGRLVDPRSPAAVAAGLQATLAERADPGVQLRLHRARTAFSWERERDRLLAAYAALRTGGRPDAVLVVRNGVDHDARVLRAARALADAGRRPLILGVVTARHTAGDSMLEGVPVRRLAPGGWRASRRPAADGAGPAAMAAASGRPLRPGLALRAARLLATADYYRLAMTSVVRLRPALVHANDHNTMWIGCAAKLLTGSRLVYDAHELWPDRNGRWEWRPWLLVTEALFVRVADAVITASPGYAERMSSRYRVPAPRVVRNIPAPSATDPSSGHDGRAADVVYVGGLMPGRGLELALEALALAPGLRLRMLGPGGEAYVERLRARAAGLGVADRLELSPPVRPGDVMREIAGSAVGLNLIEPICESYRLTLPNKLFEYLAAGVPVLSSDVPVSAGFVREHGVGDVVPALDPPAVAAAMRRLADPARRAELAPAMAAARRSVTWEAERRELMAAYAGQGDPGAAGS